MNDKWGTDPSAPNRRARLQSKTSKSQNLNPAFAPAKFFHARDFAGRFTTKFVLELRFLPYVFKGGQTGRGAFAPTKCDIGDQRLPMSLLSNSDIDRPPPRRPQKLDGVGAKSAANFERVKTSCRSVSGQNLKIASSALNTNRVQAKFFYQL